MDTVEHVSMTTTDGSVRGTAPGLLHSVNNMKFIACLQLLTHVMEAIDNVSVALQSASTNISTAQSQIAALTGELQRLRGDDSFNAALAAAESLASKLGIDCELPVERQRKVSRRLDANTSTAATALGPVEQLKVNFYFPLLDRFMCEVKERFPRAVADFACLEPRNFDAIDAEERLRRLATTYDASAVSQWRLARHLVPAETAIHQAYQLLPQTYDALRHLYKVLLTLPVTTASVERSFSKLSLVKTKLRSTMGQGRLEALLLASVEKDILLGLDDAELVARFANKSERRFLLA